MKKMILPTLLLALLVGCSEEKKKSSEPSYYNPYYPNTTSTYNGGTVNGGTVNGNVNGNVNGSTNGNTTSGGTAWDASYPGGLPTGNNGSPECTPGVIGSDGGSSPFRTATIMMAGGQEWKPNLPNQGNFTSYADFFSISSALMFSSSDYRLKVRFRIEPQQTPPTGQQYCYGRVTGQATDSHYYHKLKFKVGLRPVNSSYTDVGPVSVFREVQLSSYDGVMAGKCSPVFDFAPLVGANPYGYVFVVYDVRSDSECRTNGQFCPANKAVRSASCWKVVMDVAADGTLDFQ